MSEPSNDGEMLKACAEADWGQVIANGRPPCFQLEDERFCLRAERWQGHHRAGLHLFVSLHQLMNAALQQPRTQWQPIASAPKDGTPVDLWIPKGADPAKAHRCPDCQYGDGKWLFGGEFELQWLQEATHWQPIPDPPEVHE